MGMGGEVLTFRGAGWLRLAGGLLLGLGLIGLGVYQEISFRDFVRIAPRIGGIVVQVHEGYLYRYVVVRGDSGKTYEVSKFATYRLPRTSERITVLVGGGLVYETVEEGYRRPMWTILAPFVAGAAAVGLPFLSLDRRRPGPAAAGRIPGAVADR
jgi:hypothetical protein